MKYIQCAILAALMMCSEQVQWSCRDFNFTHEKHCDCSEIKEGNEIKCTELNSTFRIGRFGDVEIICNEVLPSKFTLPVGLGSVNSLRLQDCLSTEVSVRDLMNNLDVGRLWSVSVAGKLYGLVKGQLANLTTNVVRLEGLGLTRIDTDVFVDQNTTESDITVLYLGRNNISRLDDTVFIKLKQLHHLDMSHNQLSTLSDDLFKYNKNLNGLNFSHNHLQNISSKPFVNLNDLKELDLSHNQLTHLGGEWTGLDGLNNLYLSHNQLTSLGVGEGDESVLRQLTNLWLLDLSNNNLTRLYPDWLREMRFVKLSNNNIQTFKADSSLNGTSAMTIDLAGNNITSVDLDIPEPFTGSVGVYLENNPLNCNCHLHSFARLAKGDELFSYPISFLDIGSTTCGSPSSLQGRLVHGLLLEEFICPISDGCPPPCSCYLQPEGGYTVVNCTGVGLKRLPESLPVNHNSKQTKIILSDNQLDQSSFTFTPDLWPNVAELDLSNTSLTTFTVSGGIGQLKHLNLSYNLLTSLTDDTVRHLQSLDSLSLHHNPWRCSTHDGELWKFINNLCNTNS